MYSDEDGMASKESQSQYNIRIRMLISLTTLLSWLDLSTAVANGNYARENVQFGFSFTQLHWSTGSTTLACCHYMDCIFN
ncbi:hypothetical protein BDV27DRAFT_134516 [Aspergillus caelatus]|uniref:Uncharacterized protein n=1 Tax=Aspergillus caelatus TaxID=61420 RepID=A0A5N6ZVZ3_9EURO|nr:uncharacterized protein BDV27DRAFT_134516 [Aspergillus caelatus]KAE8360440.1 hypothetical protein BDV27DRAFT_134516 [Aspergillus caelatus]